IDAISSTLLRYTSLPALANSAIWPGPGSPASSGGLPPCTRVVSTALRSRVPSYSTFVPVASSNGLTIARKLSCSLPPQVPSTPTVPPSCFPPAASMAASFGSRRPVVPVIAVVVLVSAAGAVVFVAAAGAVVLVAAGGAVVLVGAGAAVGVASPQA